MTPPCGGCGQPVRAGAQFCTACGAPTPQVAALDAGPAWSDAAPTYVPAHPSPRPAPSPPPSPSPSRRPFLMVVLVSSCSGRSAMALFTCSAALPRLRRRSRSRRPPRPGPPMRRPRPRARSAPPAATQSPAARLDAIVAADRAAAELLVDRWVPQIASKQVGTVDAAGISLDEAAILGEVAALKARFPGAVVVRSDDFTSFRRAGFWVTLVASPSASADQANAWCVANGFAPADCFAKRLSHTAGPQGSTVTR